MKKILFPFVNGQDNKDTFVYAAKIAREMNAELILLNTFQFEVDNDITKEKYHQMLRNEWMLAYNEVHKMKSYFLSKFANTENYLKIRFDYRFVFGRIIPEIISTLEKEKIDLIVITVSNDKENNEAYYDEFISKVYKVSSSPVLAIPEKCEFLPIRKILYSKNLNDLNDQDLVLRNLGKFADGFKAKLHFLHIVEKPTDINKTNVFQLYYQHMQKPVNHVFSAVVSDDKLDALQNYMMEHKIEVLAVVKRHKGVISKFLKGSFSETVVLNSHQPVLILMDGL